MPGQMTLDEIEAISIRIADCLMDQIVTHQSSDQQALRRIRNVS